MRRTDAHNTLANYWMIRFIGPNVEQDIDTDGEHAETVPTQIIPDTTPDTMLQTQQLPSSADDTASSYPEHSQSLDPEVDDAEDDSDDPPDAEDDADKILPPYRAHAVNVRCGHLLALAKLCRWGTSDYDPHSNEEEDEHAGHQSVPVLHGLLDDR